MGTLAALGLAKQAGLVSQIKPLVDSLQAHGIHFSADLAQAILREAGE